MNILIALLFLFGSLGAHLLGFVFIFFRSTRATLDIVQMLSPPRFF